MEHREDDGDYWQQTQLARAPRKLKSAQDGERGVRDDRE
jgi:hypothetical protein